MIKPNNELRSAAGLPEGFEGPRGSILVELKRDGALSAKSLAARLGLSLNAIRHHLRELEAELDHLVSSGARDQAVESLNMHYRELGSRLSAELAGAPAEQRVARVVHVLRDEGYMTVWDGGDDQGMLTAHNCAMRAVAQQFPEICEAERNFLTEVLSADVTRQSHMLTGCSACEYHIDFRTPVNGGSVEEQA